MSNLDNVINKVQTILTGNFNNVTLEGTGQYSLRNGSARSFVRVYPRSDEKFVFVSVTVPLLFDLKPSPELNEYVAYHADDYIFGRLSLFKNDDGEIRLFLTHVLLGDYLDEPELTQVVGGMLGVADDIDDELQTRFGGTRFHEE